MGKDFEKLNHVSQPNKPINKISGTEVHMPVHHSKAISWKPSLGKCFLEAFSSIKST